MKIFGKTTLLKDWLDTVKGKMKYKLDFGDDIGKLWLRLIGFPPIATLNFQ